MRLDSKSVYRTVVLSSMVLISPSTILFASKKMELSEENLKRIFEKNAEVSSDVEQTKYSQFLFKPMVSKIKLRYSKDLITWEYTEPFKKVITINSNGVMKDLNSAANEAAEIQSNAGLKPVFNFIRSIFSLNFEELRKDFLIDISKDAILAISRADSRVKFVKSMKFEFDSNLHPSRFVIDSDSEKMELVFRNFKIGNGK